MKATTTIENGLIVNFKDTDQTLVKGYVKNSRYYGYEIENNVYLFPSPKSEYDNLEIKLTKDFNNWDIQNYYFEGV
jgi:hypothetical protein